MTIGKKLKISDMTSVLTIDDNVLIGAGSVVMKDVPDILVVYGTPRIIKERRN